ncbi:MAG: ATP-binding protein [Bacilli bacterium]|nr:ATP-binding protein [Bacilli bacterium]
MNRLIILSGVPGSGKSYFSSVLKSEKSEGVYIISSDQLRYELLGNQRDLSQDDKIWKRFYELAKEYSAIKDATVVLDSTNAKKIYRLDNIKPYRKLYDEIDVVVFQLDKETVLKQNRERENPIPENALLKLIDEFELPDEEEKEFFDHIDVIKSHRIKQIIKHYL